MKAAGRLSGFPCKGRFRYANLSLPSNMIANCAFAMAHSRQRHSPFFLRQVQHEKKKLQRALVRFLQRPQGCRGGAEADLPGQGPDGTKEILGLWMEQTEGAKFWLRVGFQSNDDPKWPGTPQAQWAQDARQILKETCTTNEGNKFPPAVKFSRNIQLGWYRSKKWWCIFRD